MSTVPSTTAATTPTTAHSTINSTVAANSVNSMTSSTIASTTTVTVPWIFQNPFRATGGSTSSGTVGSTFTSSMGSFFGSSVGVLGTNTNCRLIQPPRMMPLAKKPPKFGGIDFKRWQKKMLFYLTTLGVANFLTEDEPPTPSAQEMNFTGCAAYDSWRNGDYICKKFILNSLDDSLYNVYAIVSTSKEMWSALDKKYHSDDVGTKNFVVARFLDYKMVDSRPIMEQVDELQLLIHEVHAKGMILPDAFSVASMIEKLPPSWREFKFYLKYKRKEMTLERLVTRIRIEEDNKTHDKMLKGSIHAKANQLERGGPSNKRGRLTANNKCKGKQLIRMFDGNCYNCGKHDHLSKVCRKHA